jgi:hypothetical protein
MAAWCGICMIQSALADSAPDAGLAAREDGNTPAFEVGAEFTTRQLTYGLVDNRDPIFTLDAAAEWYGFTFEAAAIFDVTKWGRKNGGYGNSQGKWQEIAFGPGYTFAVEPFEFFVNYIYEWHPRVQKWKGEENPHTQFINVGAGLPDVFLAPSLSAEFDIRNESGAIYLLAEIGHTFTLVEAAGDRETDPLSLSLGAGVGFGNPKRNKYDAEFDTYAFKDISASVSLDWQINDTFVVQPYVAVYEQLHGRLRDAARHYMDNETHASTQLIGGLRIAASF